MRRAEPGGRVYALLLHAYPRRWRERFGAEMLDHYRALAAEPRWRGASGWWKRWLFVLRDVAVSLPAAHRAEWRARGLAQSRSRGRSRVQSRAGIRDDLRAALRVFVRAPVFAWTTVATLGVGIGAATAMFSLVDGVLLRPLPYRDAERLVQVGRMYGEIASRAVSPVDFFDLAQRLRQTESIAVSRLATMDLTGAGEPERFLAAGVSSSFFDVLDVEPVLGRRFSPAEDHRGGQALVVLSWGTWQRRYGGDPHVPGRSVVLNGRTFTIAGVMPPGFSAPGAIWQDDVEFWFPLGQIDDPLDDAGEAFVQMIARMREGATLEAVQAELAAVAARLEAERASPTPLRFWAAGLQEQTVGDSGRLLWMLFGAVSMLLLIACANVANLFLVRATERTREMAIRAALGAGRAGIARQLLSESAVLALAGGTAGAAIAWAAVEWFQAFGPDLPRMADVGVDTRVLLFTLVLSTLIGVAVGMVPVFDALRTGVADALRGAAAHATGGRVRMRLRSALVIAQTSLALTLLAGAGLLAQSMVRLGRVDAGFQADRVAWLVVEAPDHSYRSTESKLAFFEAVVERVRALPGVEQASGIHGVPLDDNRSLMNVLPDGVTLADGELPPRISWHSVMSGYFSTLGIPLVDGRDFASTDRATAPPVVIVSRGLADMLWPGERAVGRRLRMGNLSDDAPVVTVVGISGDVLHYDLTGRAEPIAYVPIAQAPRGWLGLVVRHAGIEPSSVMGALRQAVWDVDASIPLDESGTLRGQVADALREARFRAWTLTAFSTIATFLAFVGLYATLAWVVRTRRREVGIRIALGARNTDVERMVVAHGLRLAGTGVVIGTFVALAVSRVLASMVFGITSTDAPTFAAVIGGMTGVALLASWIPARRAARTDAAVTLRPD
ncbi:MAG: ABC transporter permease [Gemmatimonadetes bacterium]|nr:ABC transporter permease [Gemmatimonadota bacterium]